jgi:hypothetical protein
MIRFDRRPLPWMAFAALVLGAAPAPAQQLNRGERLPPQRELRGDPSRAFEEPPADLVPGAM